MPSIPRFCVSLRFSATSLLFWRASFRRLLAAAAWEIADRPFKLQQQDSSSVSPQNISVCHFLFRGSSAKSSSPFKQKHWFITSSVLRRRTLACFWKSLSSFSISYCRLRSYRKPGRDGLGIFILGENTSFHRAHNLRPSPRLTRVNLKEISYIRIIDFIQLLEYFISTTNCLI